MLCLGAKFTDTDVAQLIRCTQLKNKSGENYVILPGFEEVCSSLLEVKVPLRCLI